MSIVIQFVERSMDYVERQLRLLEMATDAVKGKEDDNLIEFRHVRLSADILARFMEGSSIYQLFTKEELNRFVNTQLQTGTWDFIIGLQQYAYAPFSKEEILEIAGAIAFSIAPNKTLSQVPSDLLQSPTGSEAMDNKPEDIETMIHANPWILPLAALSLSRDIPMFEAE